MGIVVLDLVFECIPSRGTMVNNSTLMMFGYKPAPTTALITAQFLLFEFKSLISPGPRCLMSPRLLNCARICRLMPATISIVPESRIDISTLNIYQTTKINYCEIGQNEPARKRHSQKICLNRSTAKIKYNKFPKAKFKKISL